MSLKFILQKKCYSANPNSPKWKAFVPESGVFPQGFLVGSVYSGVKKRPTDLTRDLSLITTTSPCVAASGVFTQNSFAAAPVQLCRDVLSKKLPVGALVINSGCANACTGPQGVKDANHMASLVSAQFLNSGSSALVMSTGVIGQQLDMAKITTGLELLGQQKLGDDYAAWLDLAKGIMTTDTFPKLLSKKLVLPHSKVAFRLAGVCKGAGMIHPNMATMLACVATDLNISQQALDSATARSVRSSFNAISIDGDTSTNDSYVVLASGQASIEHKLTVDDKDFEPFCDMLTQFSQDLATLIVRDGEGATKFVTVHVTGARTFKEAFAVASSVAQSSLVKTALFGQDANWGRIICAVGYSGVKLNPHQVSLVLSSPEVPETLQLFKNGTPFDTDETVAQKILTNTDLVLTIDLGLGASEAKMFTCDLSVDYVHINADYRS